MPYISPLRVRPRRMVRRRSLFGFGDFNDESPCSSIPAGDPYRKPGNYCATPDGGYVTFNADGSTYQSPTAGPGGPAGSSVLDKIGAALTAALTQRPPVGPTVVPQMGMSTTTKIALAGGAVLLAVVLLKR